MLNSSNDPTTFFLHKASLLLPYKQEHYLGICAPQIVILYSQIKAHLPLIVGFYFQADKQYITYIAYV